jgi:photosystem II stability/assembly factor-like uncharacterized protein
LDPCFVRTLTVLLAAALAALRVEPQSSGVTARLRGVSAISSSVAWASGDGGTILRTVDGGRTWQRVLFQQPRALIFATSTP